MTESMLDIQSSQNSSRILYSPLSPLAKGSSLHPDGLMTPLWVDKYQNMVPAVFISCFEIVADPNTDSLRDNQLKNEIAAIRASIDDSKYRSRYAVILIGDDTVINGPEFEERVINIRRAARLDEKCLFFLDPSTPEQDFADFATHVISSMQPYAMEFYRDLTRHARRKRDKGGNLTQDISRLGWIARYEYKLGIFAEFRNEMDLAERHYNNSMMALFDAQGPFETMTSWSPRWNEARIWSDTTFVRLIRAQLSIQYTTTAVRTWTRHRDRIRDLMDRKGKGSGNYGYMTWEARWSKIMAELTRNCPYPFHETSGDGIQSYGDGFRAFADVENVLSQDHQPSPVLMPWHFLHHAGYWLRRSVAYTKRRLEFALEIPEGDRVSPAQSPASSVARRSEAYDTYRSLEPHSEWKASQDRKGVHILEIVSNLGRATGDFQAHHQHRSADQLRLELCQKLMEANEHTEAMSILRPLWIKAKWRREEWQRLLHGLLLAVYECASKCDDTFMQIATIWEMSNRTFTPMSNVMYDVEASLVRHGAEDLGHDPYKLDNMSIMSPLKVQFSLSAEPAFVGESYVSQLVIKFDAHTACKPLKLRSIAIEFDDKIPGFIIQHQTQSSEDEKRIEEQNSSIGVADVRLDRSYTPSSPPYIGSANLSFHAGQARVFSIVIVPEASGNSRALKAISRIGTDNKVIEHTTWFEAHKKAAAWLNEASITGITGPQVRLNPPKTAVDILPRPPKLDMVFDNIRNIYYTGEEIRFELSLINSEDEEADIDIEIMTHSNSSNVPRLYFLDDARQPLERHEQRTSSSLGKIKPRNSTSRRLILENSELAIDIVVEARASYALTSSPGRRIEKSSSADVVMIRPFEALHVVYPDWHPDHWPDYFYWQEDRDNVGGPNASKDDITGLFSRWQSRMRITSFATETLVIDSVRLKTCKMNRHAKVHVSEDEESTNNIEIISNGRHTASFEIDVQKKSMDETRPVAIEPVVEIGWRRLGSRHEDTVITKLELQRISLAGGEPRVLARQCLSEKTRNLVIEYIIENPSMHFLTFNISIESSEDYAFSGPKQTTIQLPPLNRHGIKYLFMPLATGAHIRPDVQVLDVYFNKVLNVIPTGTLRAEHGELKASVE